MLVKRVVRMYQLSPTGVGDIQPYVSLRVRCIVILEITAHEQLVQALKLKLLHSSADELWTYTVKYRAKPLM